MYSNKVLVLLEKDLKDLNIHIPNIVAPVSFLLAPVSGITSAVPGAPALALTAVGPLILRGHESVSRSMVVYEYLVMCIFKY